MKRFLYFFFALIVSISTIVSCNDDDYLSGIPEDLEIQNFIWKGLNAYYYWQQDMPDLSDQRFTSQEQLNDFLSGYDDPEVLFYSLLNDYPIIDKYSWIVDDSVALDEYLQEGIKGTTGAEFKLLFVEGSETDLYGVIEYILPDSDASTKNIQRGNVFNAVDGIPLTTDNYRQLLFSTESYTLNLADYNNGNPIDNGQSVSLIKDDIQENPIYVTNTINDSGKNIGYLMYNGFTPAFDNQLNDVFLDFKNDGITDLVLDLRYNSGGSILTATYLASMITGQFTDQLFTKELWNDKWQNYFENENPNQLFNIFVDQIVNGGGINNLSLNSIVILTTDSSASASELLINGLNPYINVTTIGTKTEGKVFGSVTLYDSKNYSKNNVNPNHTWAMQPLVLETFNKLDENHPEGIEPTILFPEDPTNPGILGDPNEPLFARAITFITTGSKADFTIDKRLNIRSFTNSKRESIGGSAMFVEIE